MSQDAFADIPVITYEGPDSRNALAFKHYDAEAVVEGRTMAEQLRFACAYWHTMRNPLDDPFGVGTAQTPWDDGTDSVENALRRVDVFFEFLNKIGIQWYCFHDRDVAPEGVDIPSTNDNLQRVVEGHGQPPAGQRSPAAVGDGLPVQPFTVRARRGDVLPGGCLRPCRIADSPSS